MIAGTFRAALRRPGRAATLALLLLGFESPASAEPLTLTGDFLEVGISDYGTFGSDGNTAPGLLHDPSGARNFAPGGIPNDYLTPGTPHDGFAINSVETGLKINDNDGYQNDFGTASPTRLSGTAANGYSQAASWTVTLPSLLTITNSYYFDTQSEKILVVTNIKALTNLTKVAFGRSEDPDPDVNRYGDFQTVNTRGDKTTAPQDLVSAAGQRTGLTLGIYNASGNTYAHNTEISGFCCNNDDPYNVLSNAATLAFPDTNLGDYGLQIAWMLGDMKAGQSDTISYEYIFGTNQPRVVMPLPTINTRDGDIAPNIYSLGSPAAKAELVDFEGGTLRMTGGSFPDNIIPTTVLLGLPNGTVDTSTGNGGFSGLVMGAGSLTIEGGGIFSLTHANVYAGGTIIDGSTASISDSAALGTGTITFEAGTLLIAVDGLALSNTSTLSGSGTIDTQNFTVTLLGAIGGSGPLIKIGTGVLQLGASSSFTGGTELVAGTLVIAASDALGTGALSMNVGTTLAFAIDNVTFANDIVFTRPGDPTIDTGSNTVTISGSISGRGDLDKLGTGLLDLTGTNTYTGATNVEQGALVVDGSTATSVATVQSGAVLGGSGTIGGLNLLGGAVLAPGIRVPFSTLNVAGNAVLASGSTFAVNIDPSGRSDAVAITGSATIGGGTVAIAAQPGNYTAANRYTILTATAGRSGQFGTLTTNTDFAFLQPSLSYDPTHVYLGFTQTAPFASAATTPNQRATAGAVQSLGPGNPLYQDVLVQSPAGARQAFGSLSGEAHASVPAVAIAGSRFIGGAIFDRFWNIPVDGGGDAVSVLDQFGTITSPALLRCYTPDQAGASGQTIPSTYTVWGQAVGEFGRLGTDGNAANVDRTLGGFVFGIDSKVDATIFSNWRVGVAGGYTSDSFSVGQGGGSGTFENAFGALYGGARYGAVDVRVGASYGGTSTTSHRTVAFPGFLEAERSNYGGDTVQGFGEIGYRFGVPRAVIEPVLDGGVNYVHQDSFREKGGIAALVGSSEDVTVGFTTLGVRSEVTPLAGVPLVARLMLGWEHSYGDVNPASRLAFASGSQAFDIYGTPIDRDALVAETDLTWRVTPAASVAIAYTGQIGQRDRDNGVKGKFDYRF